MRTLPSRMSSVPVAVPLAVPLPVKALAVVAVTAWVLAVRTPLAAALALLLVAVGFAVSGQLRELLRTSLQALPVLVLLGGFQFFAAGWEAAAAVPVGILACVGAAQLLVATTPVPVLLDGLSALVRPLRRFGADPERFALAVGLMLRSLPWLSAALRDARQAAAARGLGRSPRALLVPAVVGTVAYARRTGDALAARGLGDRQD
ncbi:Energy-coupling factor transporter transmembrane protein BioN [Arthrobacter saudimassiliensis]|uniref:Energy-coupling factor transporter transmembrane protein BioN n=1 Tax=Arthrobacter saudimassiliensis TaxID=1461584 RepID=A0A078MLA2_9MICC|nr:Energy-coupling factor transporter transmembrane protein BioN [Arthrobacter saudimassiliensis]